MHEAIYVHGHEFFCNHKNNNTVFSFATACGVVKCYFLIVLVIYHIIVIMWNFSWFCVSHILKFLTIDDKLNTVLYICICVLLFVCKFVAIIF